MIQLLYACPAISLSTNTIISPKINVNREPNSFCVKLALVSRKLLIYRSWCLLQSENHPLSDKISTSPSFLIQFSQNVLSFSASVCHDKKLFYSCLLPYSFIVTVIITTHVLSQMTFHTSDPYTQHLNMVSLPCLITRN